MRAKEREAWLSRNVGKGGKRPSFDQFNKSHKGFERNPSAKEYWSQGLEAYHRYAETKDTRRDEDENKDRSSDKSQKRNDASSKVKSNSGNAVRNVVSRVVVTATASVVIVNSYETIKAKKAEVLPATPVVAESVWEWSDDFDSAKIGLYDGDGKLIAEIPAEILLVSETAPTCSSEGEKVYSATATYEDGKTYSDTKTQTLEKTEHSFGEETEIIHEDGTKEYVSECSVCHEEVRVVVKVTED